jgi:predicted membrane chloride channel (bestrophin family)
MAQLKEGLSILTHIFSIIVENVYIKITKIVILPTKDHLPVQIISTSPKNWISEALSIFLGSRSTYSRIIITTTVSIKGCHRSLKYVVVLSWH